MKKGKLFFSLLSFTMVLPLISCKTNKDKEEEKKEDEHQHSYVVKYNADGHWEECECGDKKNIVAHTIVLDSTTPATCADTQHDYMKCSGCEYQYVVEGTTKLPHIYSVSIKTPATCIAPGVKHYECSNCHESFDLDYEDYNLHAWNSGTVNDGVTTFTCSHCSETYTVLDYSTKKEVTVTTEALSQAGGIQLQTATIQLDADTLEALDENVSISAETVETSEVVNIIKDENSKKLIEDAPVFDFTMKNGNEDVHELGGLVTITVPYTLKNGENADDISIAYIPDDGGKLEHISGHYNAGSVTFETSHFSKYAIVKLTPEEACQEFGHNRIKTKSGTSTCITHGYDSYSCTRCGEQTTQELPLVEHNYVYSRTEESTSTVHGYIENKCSVCGDVVHEELPLIPETHDNYAMNIVRSLLDSNFAINVGESEGTASEPMSIDIIFAPNASTPFMTMNNNAYFSNNFALIGNKHYSYSSLTNLEDSTMTDILRVFNQIKAAPEPVETVVNFVFETLNRVLLKKTTSNGFDIYQIDFDKVRALVDASETKDLVTLIDMIFGEGFYDKVYTFVSNCFTKTVAQTLDYLKEIKLDVEQIFDFIGILSNGKAPKYEDIFTEEALKTKTIDFIKGMIPVDLSSIENMTQIDSYINQYKDKTLKEVIGLFAEDDIDLIFDTINDFVDALEKSLDFEIKLTSYGQFVSGEFNLELTQEFSDVTDADAPLGSYVCGSVKTSFDVNAELVKANSLATKIEKANRAFSSEAIGEALCEYAESIYGVNFTYYPSDEYGREFIQSDKSSKIYSEFHEADEDFESALRVYLESDQYSSTSSFFDLHNIYGLKDNRSFPSKSVRTDSYEIVFNKVSGASSTDWLSSTYLEVVYDITNESIFVAREQSHLYETTKISKTEFDNLRESMGYMSYKYEIPLYSDEVSQECYYKEVCKICGNISLFIAPENYKNNQYCYGLTTSKMNKEALSYLINVNTSESRNISYYDGTNYGYIACENLTKISVQKVFGTSEYLGSSSGECDFKNRTYHYGNVSISYAYSRVSGSDCKINETITIKVDNDVIAKYKNALHTSSSYFHSVRVVDKVDGCITYYHEALVCDDCKETVYILDHYISTDHAHNYQYEKIKTEGCGTYYHVVDTCTKCGKVINDYFTWAYNHDYQYFETVRPGYLFESYDVYKCSECDEYDIRNLHFEEVHSSDYNSETGLYHCDVCDEDYLMQYHYHFELLNPDHYIIESWKGGADDSYAVGCRNLNDRWSYSYIDTDYSWDCYIGLVSYDEDGEIQFGEKFEYQFESYGEAYLRNYNHWDYFYNYSRCPILLFNKTQIDSLLANASEDEKLCIIFVHKYENGLIQIYDFPPIE